MPKIYHNFPLIPNSQRLAYVPLTVANCHCLVEIFQGDESLFIDKRFKNEKEAKEYAQESETAKYYAKYGGCDFLIHLKDSETYIGILHLFDLSLETFMDKHLGASIGFAIAEPFHRQYYATEAVRHLIDYVQNTLQRPNILAYTHPENEVANDFLLSLNLVLNTEDYIFGYNYYELK
jgi:RimJ/RimL family protein N-acetyltransferase